jgi:hypothetical protein
MHCENLRALPPPIVIAVPPPFDEELGGEPDGAPPELGSVVVPVVPRFATPGESLPPPQPAAAKETRTRTTTIPSPKYLWRLRMGQLLVVRTLPTGIARHR